jgi:hypothetical protein
VWGQGEPIRLINNPASWGAADPVFSLLGFSKGSTQNKAMSDVKAGNIAFEDVPFKSMRKRLSWLLRALRLLKDGEQVDWLFHPSETRFQSSSLIRCSISAQDDNGNYSYKLKDILDVDSKSGGRVREIMCRCAKQHLANATVGHSFILMGLDKDLIKWCKAIFTDVFGSINVQTATTYRTQQMSWVHVSHPSGNQTDPQYLRWCEGKTRIPKVIWAREEIFHRNGGER